MPTIIQHSESVSGSTKQAIAIMAVDNLRPSQQCIELMHQIDTKQITYEQAVAVILQKALGYATNTP